MNSTLIAGQAVSALVARHSPEEIQHLLRTVRSEGGHAACRCRHPALRLAIRERSSKLFLAAWRDESELHEPACPFYSERSEYRPTALAQAAASEDHEVDHPPRLYEVRARIGIQGAPQLDLIDALHHLWDTSGLSRWFPGWRRDYPLARKVLLKAAGRISLGGEVLAHNLYIPPVFRAEKRHEINIQWDEFIAGLVPRPEQTSNPSMRFIVGTLRHIAQTQFGGEISLHHNATPLYMSEKVMAAVQRHNRKAWTCLKAFKPDEAKPQTVLAPQEHARVVCLAQVFVSRAGYVHIARCALLRTTVDLIPANNRWEHELAQRLVEEDREFFRPMSHQESRVGLPSYVLKDTDPTRRVYTELFITGHDGASPAMEERHVRELGEQAHRRHREALYWTIREQREVPALPPATAWAPQEHA